MMIVRSDIEAIVGVDNVIKWADLNNNRNAGEITARVDYAIALAESHVLSKLRLLTYDVTSASGLLQIKHIAAIKAADILYGPRKVDEADQDKDLMKSYRDEMKDFFKEAASGRLDLGIARDCRPYPAVITDGETTTELPDGIIAVWRSE